MSYILESKDSNSQIIIVVSMVRYIEMLGLKQAQFSRNFSVKKILGS